MLWLTVLKYYTFYRVTLVRRMRIVINITIIYVYATKKTVEGGGRNMYKNER
jgi:hypothetical protein